MISGRNQRLKQGVFFGFLITIVLVLDWTKNKACVGAFAPRTNKTIQVMFQDPKQHQEIYNQAIKTKYSNEEDGPTNCDDPGTGGIVEFEINNLNGKQGQMGIVRILLRPDWAPLGVERFEELVKDNFFMDCRFFRVVPNFIAQVGLNGDPSINQRWKPRTIQDDPVTVSNTYGTVVFATAGPNTRTTQIFINTNADGNPELDEKGFAPFGEVIEGMNFISNQLYAGYDGEGPPNGNGPSQRRIREEGNTYLESSFPKLSYISNVNSNFDADDDN